MVADTKLGTTTQVCDGTQESAEGDWSSCQLNLPTALFHYGDTVYIGSVRANIGILMNIEGNVKKLFIDLQLSSDLMPE